MQENNPNNEIIDLIIRSLRKELDVEEEKTKGRGRKKRLETPAPLDATA